MDYLKNDKKPVVIIDTHHHWDHIWGNHVFNGYTIISHMLCREMIVQKWDEMLDKQKQFIRGNVGLSLPNLVFEAEIYFPDDKIRIFYTPGHTADSISVLDEEEGVLNAGDNVGDTTDEIIPSIETEKELYIKTLLRYKSIEFDTCVSGHNIVLGKEVVDTILKEMD